MVEFYNEYSKLMEIETFRGRVPLTNLPNLMAAILFDNIDSMGVY